MINVEKLRAMSVQDLAVLGADDLAYVRPIKLENEVVFSVSTADGRQIAVTEDRETAILAANQQRYYAVSVH